jgi:23S rRNA (adenine2030-N6)-methyltransferase
MLSYRHAFHAGNHADVFKHLVLTLIVRSLKDKDKPFFCLDTHSGAGRYDLHSDLARKNREYETGIAKLRNRQGLPEICSDYITAVAAVNPGGGSRYYPGSPRILRHCLRPGDRLALCEIHPREVETLNAEFTGDKQVKVHELDAYQSLKALLPPPERRGLVHIDPAYELKDERQRLLDAVKEGYCRWPTGIYAVWHPIQDRYAADDFLRRFQRLGIRKMLAAELSVLDQDESQRLVGSGMVVINPPWKLEGQLHELLPRLWEVLSMKRQGGHRVAWLAEE